MSDSTVSVSFIGTQLSTPNGSMMYWANSNVAGSGSAEYISGGTLTLSQTTTIFKSPAGSFTQSFSGVFTTSTTTGVGSGNGSGPTTLTQNMSSIAFSWIGKQETGTF